MPLNVRCRLAPLVALLWWIFAPGAARAEMTVRACVQAHEEGQVHEQQGQLLAAAKSFRSCAENECPGPVRSECAVFWDRVRAALPSVVLAIRSGNQEITGAEVFVDGEPVKHSLGGRPISLNPGRRVIRVDAGEYGSVEKTVVIRQAERDRLVSLELPSSTPQDAIPPAAGQSRWTPPVLVAAGIGTLGAASFAAFALAGRASEAEFDACRPNCPRAAFQDHETDMRRNYMLADVSLAVSLLGWAAAIWFWTDPPALAEPKSGEGLSANALVGQTELRLEVKGRF